MLKGEETSGLASTSSAVMVSRRCAFGFSAPFAQFLTATCAICSRVVPNSYMCRTACGAKMVAAVLA